jgi:hypothetical protein
LDVVADETIHSSVKTNTDGISKDIKQTESFPVSGTIKVLENELKCTLSCGREQQINFYTGEMKVTSDARMKDVCLTLKPEAWKSKTGM